MPDIGIIGGADGHTAIFVTSSGVSFIWLAAAGMAIACAAFFLIRKRKNK